MKKITGKLSLQWRLTLITALLMTVTCILMYFFISQSAVAGMAISTTSTKNPGNLTAACAMRMSWDEKYVYCTNAGENTVSIYSRDEETGLLSMICCLPISGEYPKDVAVFPDGKHIASINHDSGSISFFKVDYEKGLLVMSGRSIPVNEPNCCAIVKIGD